MPSNVQPSPDAAGPALATLLDARPSGRRENEIAIRIRDFIIAAGVAGKGVQNGILTDVLRWPERNVGETHHAGRVSR